MLFWYHDATFFYVGSIILIADTPDPAVDSVTATDVGFGLDPSTLSRSLALVDGWAPDGRCNVARTGYYVACPD